MSGGKVSVPGNGDSKVNKTCSPSFKELILWKEEKREEKGGGRKCKHALSEVLQ